MTARLLLMLNRRLCLQSALGLAPWCSPVLLSSAQASPPLNAETLEHQVRRQIDQVFADLSALPSPLLTKPVVSVRFEPFLIGVDLPGGGKPPELILPTWEQLIPAYREVFERWMRLAQTGLSALEFFEGTFQWALVVHEVGHVLHFNHRQTAGPLGFFREEELANRLMVAWCYSKPDSRERLDRLGRTWTALYARLPNPIPSGQQARSWFEANYEKLGQDPDAYGWFQFRWMASAWEDRANISLADAVSALTRRTPA